MQSLENAFQNIILDPCHTAGHCHCFVMLTTQFFNVFMKHYQGSKLQVFTLLLWFRIIRLCLHHVFACFSCPNNCNLIARKIELRKVSLMTVGVLEKHLC